MLSIKIKDLDTSISYVINIAFLGLPIDIPELLRQYVDQFETLRFPPNPANPGNLAIFPALVVGYLTRKPFQKVADLNFTRVRCMGNLNFKCEVLSGGIHVLPDPRTSSRGKCLFCEILAQQGITKQGLHKLCNIFANF